MHCGVTVIPIRLHEMFEYRRSSVSLSWCKVHVLERLRFCVHYRCVS